MRQTRHELIRAAVRVFLAQLVKSGDPRQVHSIGCQSAVTLCTLLLGNPIDRRSHAMPEMTGTDWCGQHTTPAWVRWAQSARDGQVHAFPLEDSQHGRWPQAVCDHITPPTARHASSIGPRCPACVLGVSAPGTARRHRRIAAPGLGARLWARFHRPRHRNQKTTPTPEFPDLPLPLPPRSPGEVRVPGTAGPTTPMPDGLVSPCPTAPRLAPFGVPLGWHTSRREETGDDHATGTRSATPRDATRA